MKLDAFIENIMDYSYQDCTMKIKKNTFTINRILFIISLAACIKSSYATGLARTQLNHSCSYITYTRYIYTMYATRGSERERQLEGKSRATVGGSRGSGCSSDGGCVG